MKRPTNLRTALIAAGAAAVAVIAGTVAAQATDIRGAVNYEGGAVIPEGQIEIRFEDPAIQADMRDQAAETRVESDGKSKTIAFSLPLTTASSTGSRTLQIVAILERADGWLLARGSAKVEANASVHVTLNEAMY